MKKRTRCLLAMMITCLVSATLLSSCKGNKDGDITAAIEAKKKDMKEMAGITAAVEKGVVTLNGECPDAETKSMCEQTIGAIPGVKQVVNNCTIAPPPPPPAPAPVVIAADDPLTKSVNDAIKDYPGVSATVKDGEVTLTGTVKRASLQKLMMGLHALKPKKITNQLTLK